MQFSEADSARLEAALIRLGQVGSESEIRQVLADVAAPIVAAISALAPVDEGLLRRSVRTRFVKRPSRGVYTQVISVDAMRRAFAETRSGGVASRVSAGGTGQSRVKVYYASFVEYGHKIGSRKSGIENVYWHNEYGRKLIAHRIDHRMGSVPEKPFLRPAFDARESAAIETIEQKMLALIPW